MGSSATWVKELVRGCGEEDYCRGGFLTCVSYLMIFCYLRMRSNAYKIVFIDAVCNY